LRHRREPFHASPGRGAARRPLDGGGGRIGGDLRRSERDVHAHHARIGRRAALTSDRPIRAGKQQPALPSVGLIASGGTIESVGVDRLDLAWYLESGKQLEDGQLTTRVPELGSIARIEAVPFRRIPSHAITDADLFDLAGTVQGAIDSGRVHGIVIAHGTNTLEETAFFLHLTVRTERPIVVVGAMRPASGLSADGDLNLLNAVRVAADPASAGMGVLVVLNDSIFSARDVTKTATFRVDAFQARDLGPLGYADADGRVVYYHQPLRRHTLASEFDLRRIAALPRVDIVVSYLGADGALIDAAVAAGARGIISAGTGAGWPTPGERHALERASEAGVLVSQGSRVGSGRTVRSPELKRRGWVATDNLPPWKARLLLRLALATTSDPDEVQRIVDTY
jgi:L-asparaginase